MKWSDYYEHYDCWQESTQYSRLASIADWGPESSPSEQIADCICYVDDRTAASILRRALAANVRFRPAEVVKIVDSGLIDNEKLLLRLVKTSDEPYTGAQLCTLLEDIFDNDPILELLDQTCSQPTHFTEKEVLSLLPYLMDEDAVNKVAGSTDAVFSEDGLNKLCDNGLDETLVERISRRSGIPYSDPNADEDFDDEPVCTAPRAKKPGLLSALLMGFAMGGTPAPSNHSGRCSGDCANCPPHYGYRYGRWYYGHGHSHGCEFGGNGGCSGKCSRD